MVESHSKKNLIINCSLLGLYLPNMIINLFYSNSATLWTTWNIYSFETASTTTA